MILTAPAVLSTGLRKKNFVYPCITISFLLMHHIVWLINHTSTKAISGMTPYEAVFSRKPDLSGLREWGKKVWVHIEGGDKLGGHVHEGRWLGVDEKLKGACIYWPDMKTVNVERNVYVNKTSASHFEGKENGWMIKTNSDLPVTMVYRYMQGYQNTREL